MIYLLIFLYILILAFLYEFGNFKGGKKANKIILFFIFVSLSGFRFRIGGDTYYYMIMYKYLPKLSELININVGPVKLQPLWVLLNAIAKSIYEDFYVLQIIHALIINYIIFQFFNKYTKYFFTAILLYFIGFYGYFNFEIMRESLAVCFFLLSIESFMNERWIKYYLFVAIAFGFHYSAIILFFFPLLKKIPISFFNVSVLLLLGIFLNKYILNFMSSIGGAATFILYLKNYADYQYTMWGLLSIVILYVLYPSIIFKISKSFLKIKSLFYPFLHIYILIGVLSTFYFIFFRFLNYLTPIIFLFLTEIIHGFVKRKDTRPIAPIIFFIIFSLILLVHTSRYFTDTSGKVTASRWYSLWYPYSSIFNKKEDATREALFRNL